MNTLHASPGFPGPLLALQCSAQEPKFPLYAYRERTLALLKRYFRCSVEVGRLPALLGREFFRARVSSYRFSGFEDSVIFVHDVERCLQELDIVARQLIARIVFQEYTADETAALLRCARRTVVRRYMEALDSLSEIFLAKGLLREFASVRKPSSQAQEPREASNEKAAGMDLLASAENSSAAVQASGSAPAAHSFGKLCRLVKPPFSRISSQAILSKANIFFGNVSHFPPSV